MRYKMKQKFEFQYECAKICFIYLVLGFLWIYFSDKIAYYLAPSKDTFLLINNYKGWVYVIITAIILYLLISEFFKKVEQSKNEVLYLSYHDVLTGVYNRRYYEQEIKWLDIEKNLPISIIMADVNGLKMINDAFGHYTGDNLLQKSAKAIKSACRPQDLLARWGGDEFIVLLPNTTSAEAEAVSDRIKDICKMESFKMFKISMSIGWDTKSNKETDLEEVLKNAEDHMYKYKIILNQGLRGNLINTIVNALYEKNPREEQHSERVGDVSQKIGSALDLSDIEISKLKVMGHLHDIGKIAIDEGILNKADHLTESEREKINRHPEIGFRILSASNEMIEIAECILAHHERWDGKGYPRGLSGEEIPLAARIISLADSYDAMTSERPYRNALSEEKFLQEIRENAGSQFDPEIARTFVEKVLKKQWEPIDSAE